MLQVPPLKAAPSFPLILTGAAFADDIIVTGSIVPTSSPCLVRLLEISKAIAAIGNINSLHAVSKVARLSDIAFLFICMRFDQLVLNVWNLKCNSLETPARNQIVTCAAWISNISHRLGSYSIVRAPHVQRICPVMFTRFLRHAHPASRPQRFLNWALLCN